MEIRKSKIDLEKECKNNNLMHRGETNLSEIYYCKASIVFYLAPERKIECQKFCSNLDFEKFYRHPGRNEGHYLCTHVPKKSNS